MLPKESLDWIVSVEEQVGDLTASYANVDIWPILRNSMLLAVLGESGKAWPKKKPGVSKTVRFFRSLRALVKPRNADIFVVTDIKYSETIQGTAHIKDVDSLRLMEQNKGKSMLLALSDEPDRPLAHSPNEVVSLYAVRVISGALSRFLSLLPMPARVKRTIDFASEVTAATGNLGLSQAAFEKRLRRNVAFVVVATSILKMLLSKTNTKEAFIHCYYSPFGMAFCAACRKLEISVSDIQHGIAGRNMRAYGRWENCPPGGFSTMPTGFLSWTDSDAAAINEWSVKAGLGSIARNTGQLWFEYFKNSHLFEFARQEWKPFLNSIENFEKRIVITLQFPEIDPRLHHLIISSSRDICFLIRAHPNGVGSCMPTELANLVSQYGNVYLYESTVIPIHLLMQFSDLNITGWSASVYDSYFVGIGSLLISDIGKSYFENMQSQNYVNNASSVDEIADYIGFQGQGGPNEF